MSPSEKTPAGDTALLEEIAAEAERIRSAVLPAGFERDLKARFAAIASDSRALEAELARRAEAQPSATDRVGRAAGLARRAGGRAVSSSRRRVGPRVRSIERRSLETTARLAEVGATRYEVLRERARRTGRTPVVHRLVARVAGPELAAAPAPAGSPRALHVGPEGLVDEELDRFLKDRFERVAGTVVHVESGDGALVAALQRRGVAVRGADAKGSERLGPLEALSREPASSLGGIVVSGLPDRVTPASARALARLVASRLAPGAPVVLLSSHPGPRLESDPVASDLARAHALHPVTWCHLFARLGLGEVTVAEAKDGSAYAIAARRSGSRP